MDIGGTNYRVIYVQLSAKKGEVVRARASQHRQIKPLWTRGRCSNCAALAGSRCVLLQRLEAESWSLAGAVWTGGHPCRAQDARTACW